MSETQKALAKHLPGAVRGGPPGPLPAAPVTAPHQVASPAPVGGAPDLAGMHLDLQRMVKEFEALEEAHLARCPGDVSGFHAKKVSEMRENLAALGRIRAWVRGRGTK